MCAISYVYTLKELAAMTTTETGFAVWEYVNDLIPSEMIEAYGSIELAAAAAVDCFVDDPETSETSEYLCSLGSSKLTAAVVAYLETQV